ncbi:hypothetical protein NP233_g2177 [Leucocoprinus birnbaumii]|uniref:Uncharacterized protein n=1 Tax=Leucocoprinus birnbaumii TaxID=56174 RepID=A0AAD5W4V0_9AGAR|nr:hypothetical protein NP233_g2177 [Leucocoprinus birnbaumii]
MLPDKRPRARSSSPYSESAPPEKKLKLPTSTVIPANDIVLRDIRPLSHSSSPDSDLVPPEKGLKPSTAIMPSSDKVLQDKRHRSRSLPPNPECVGDCNRYTTVETATERGAQ